MTTSDRQLAYLDVMGVQVWQERFAQEALAPEDLGVQVETTSLEELYNVASTCQRCDASTIRKQVVFGDGPTQADWLIVGDFPTEQDETQGHTLTGDPARLLSEMLLAVGLKKSAVYLTNSVKCRSANIAAENTELLSCRAFLIRQIQLVNPLVIFVLGEKAAQSLLISNDSLSNLMGKVKTAEDIHTPIVVSHHPRYLLQTPSAKKQAWDAIQLARNVVFDHHVG